MNNLTIDNTENLDSSILDSLGISGGTSLNGGELFYNTSNYSSADGKKISPEMVQAGLGLATVVASGVGRNRASQGVCKRPLIRENALNRGKWSDYRACLTREERAKERELAIEQARAEAEREKRANKGGGEDDYTMDDDKIFGMPKGLAIGLGVALVGVLGLVIYKVVKAKQA